MNRAERRQLSEVLDDFRRWSDIAGQARRLAAHMPISGAVALDPDALRLFGAVETIRELDLESAAVLTRSGWFTGRKSRETAVEASQRVAAAHTYVVTHFGADGPAPVLHALSERATAEVDFLRNAIGELEPLRLLALRALHDAVHLPLTRSDVLAPALAEDLAGIVHEVDEHRVPAGHVLDGSACAAGDCTGHHNAAEGLVRAYAVIEEDGTAAAVRATAKHLTDRKAQEQALLTQWLGELGTIRTSTSELLDEAAHLPIRHADAIDRDVRRTLDEFVSRLQLHAGAAQRLLAGTTCAAGTCKGDHGAAVEIAELHAEASGAATLAVIKRAREKVRQLAAADRDRLQVAASQIGRWTDQIATIRRAREEAKRAVRQRVEAMLMAAVSVKFDRGELSLLPVSESDRSILGPLKLLSEHPITRSDEAILEAASSLRDDFNAARSVVNSHWDCNRECGKAHSIFATTDARLAQLQTELERLMPPAPAPSNGSLEQLLDSSSCFDSFLPQNSRPVDLLMPELTAAACSRAAELADRTLADAAARAANAAAEKVRATDIQKALAAMDLQVLRKACEWKVRITPLAAEGLNSVWDVLKFIRGRYDLAMLPGLGDSSAFGIEQAALRLHDAVRDDMPVRIDVKRRSKSTTALLEALRVWDLIRRDTPSVDEFALAKAFAKLASKRPHRVLVIAKPDDLPRASEVGGLIQAHIARRFPDAPDVWTDFLTRPSDYFGMLTELGFVTEDEKKMHGDLPEEIVEAVRAKELKREFVTASLRTYQSFGARFALVQEKVVIGDEMGLGKTVEALAVMAHLRASGQSHFVVVCPASVVSNWMRETAKHTKFRAFRLHGQMWERASTARAWVRVGGVAVTTYDLLWWAMQFIDQVDVGCSVFDEAHYIKNPTAKRSLAAQDLLAETKFSVLMTGTPLENSVQEFRNLIGYIRPDLADSAPDYLPSKFRRHVAPVYLRRNQEDVLTELPERVDVDEWLAMSPTDEVAYKEAVQDGNFMLMRRVAMLSLDSSKRDRLVQIVAEAEANGRRVIVYSYFREVLDAVSQVLPGRVFGPLTGSVPASQRQEMVDRFSAAAGGAVLVAQIVAGGVGLNIQSASVVVICEPQLKPTLEDQAIARAHRMGQTTTVQVHRLLIEDSVDERIREILAEKRRLFDEFARDSVIAEGAPDAVDMSDADLARMVVAQERERLFGSNA